MAEYIDRKALIGKLEKRYCVPCKEQDGDLYGDWCRFCMASNAIKEVQKTPAADVEPVVRCRECKHHYWVQEPCHGKSVHYCKLPHMSGVEVFKEFFCYYGERKEGADND